MVLNKKQLQAGSSLVEILIVSAIMLVVFGGLLTSFRYSLELISHSRAKLTALTLANDTMEYVRSLSYNTGGTVSGIPSGYPVNTPGFGGTAGLSLQQTVSGLIAGNTYVLEFWAGGESLSWYTESGVFAVDVGFGNIFMRCKPSNPNIRNRIYIYYTV